MKFFAVNAKECFSSVAHLNSLPPEDGCRYGSKQFVTSVNGSYKPQKLLSRSKTGTSRSGLFNHVRRRRLEAHTNKPKLMKQITSKYMTRGSTERKYCSLYTLKLSDPVQSEQASKRSLQPRPDISQCIISWKFFDLASGLRNTTMAQLFNRGNSETVGVECTHRSVFSLNRTISTLSILSLLFLEISDGLLHLHRIFVAQIVRYESRAQQKKTYSVQ